jgi:Mn-dependent DtxR family transcriptional regulator
MALSSDLRRFVVAKLPSVSHLEALLLLRSTGAAWPIEQLSARLYVSLPYATQLVDDLQERGLAVHLGENAQYLPKTERAARAVDELATTYGRSLIEVTQLIHSVNERKARRFADAFLMRKDS